MAMYSINNKKKTKKPQKVFKLRQQTFAFFSLYSQTPVIFKKKYIKKLKKKSTLFKVQTRERKFTLLLNINEISKYVHINKESK